MLRRTAFHEASHAVVSALLGQKILWIEIHQDGHAETVPDTNIFLRLDEPFESRRRMVIAMAGSAGQCRSKAEVWENVSRLADALLRCRRLEGSELDELLPNWDPMVCKMAECG